MFILFQDAYELLRTDSVAFEYLYVQCCNDVVQVIIIIIIVVIISTIIIIMISIGAVCP